MVATAVDGFHGLHQACNEDWDMVILDLLLPDLPGKAILAALRVRKPSQRVMVLSALGDTESRVGCLEHGAVDYVSKPFSIREFRARLRSRLEDAPRVAGAVMLSSAGLELDMVRRRVTYRGGTVELSPREFLLVQHLMCNAGSVSTREELLHEVWGYAFDPGSNVVDVTIARLRAKLDTTVIETIRNVGYALAV